MKQGSTDDPFAEESGPDPDTHIDGDTGDRGETDPPERRETLDPTTDENTDRRADPSPTVRTLPYIYKRDAVKDDRTQRPVYLREYNEERIPELKTAVEEALGEEVTKTDVLEAALETAIENPSLVADTLRTERYGYDWE